MGVGYYCAAAAYIRTTQGWLYLRVVIDLASRKVIGWSLSQTMIAGDTIVPAWKMAVKNHPITDELIFHSDRGVQYACHEFRKLIKGYSLVRQSMSRKGNCWDNAVAESFFKTLKAELIYMVEPTTVAETKVDVFEFIEIWRPPLRYNRKRMHASLGYLTPMEYEAKLKLNYHQNAA